jgi:hypothetical protein
MLSKNVNFKICETTIALIVSYRYETLSLKLEVSENTVLREMFGLPQEEAKQTAENGE